MTQTVFDPKAPAPLTPNELELLSTLQTALEFKRKNLEKQGKPFNNTFTVDTLRKLGADRFIQKDKRGHYNYGPIFLKWKVFGYIEPTGRYLCSKLESNHGHKVQEWRLKKG